MARDEKVTETHDLPPDESASSSSSSEKAVEKKEPASSSSGDLALSLALLPTLDFAAEFIDPILRETKQATTRVLSRPDGYSSLDYSRKRTQNGLTTPEEIIVGSNNPVLEKKNCRLVEDCDSATNYNDSNDIKCLAVSRQKNCAFCLLHIKQIEFFQNFEQMPLRVAQTEGYESKDAFLAVLKKFYPNDFCTKTEPLCAVHFKVFRELKEAERLKLRAISCSEQTEQEGPEHSTGENTGAQAGVLLPGLTPANCLAPFNPTAEEALSCLAEVCFSLCSVLCFELLK